MKKFFILLPLLGLFSFNAYAHNCAGQFDPASGSCRIIGPDGREIIYNSDPPQTSNYGSTYQAPRIIYHAKYGALAINYDSGEVEVAHNQDSKRKAKKLALAKVGCKQENYSCQILSVVRNGCMAAAFGTRPSGRLMAVGGIDERGKSEAAALHRCQLTNSSNCKIFIPEACSHSDPDY